jgi:hypothetical protein
MRSNRRLRLEFLADLSRLLRSFDVDIPDNVLAEIIVATDQEVAPRGPEPQIDPP